MPVHTEQKHGVFSWKEHFASLVFLLIAIEARHFDVFVSAVKRAEPFYESVLRENKGIYTNSEFGPESLGELALASL